MTRRRWDLRHNRPIGRVSSGKAFYGSGSDMAAESHAPGPLPPTPTIPEHHLEFSSKLVINATRPSYRFDTGSFHDVTFFQDRLDSGSLRRARFQKRDLSNAVFVNVDLAEATFVECDLRNVLFFRCDLRGAFLDGPTCENTVFIDCDVENADIAYVGRSKMPLIGTLKGILEPARSEASMILGAAAARVAREHSINGLLDNYDGTTRHRVMKLNWTKMDPRSSRGRLRQALRRGTSSTNQSC